MKNEQFGLNVNYYNERNISRNISKLVKEDGFSDFSPEGLTSYLTFRHPIGDISMFRGYNKLPFGDSMVGDKKETFWYPCFSDCRDSFEDASKTIDDLLVKSIDKLIQGKNRVAVTLSGGLDSSIIVSILRKNYPDMDIYTYSAGFYGDDEFEYSRFVAKENMTIHKEKILGSEEYIGPRSMLRSLIKFKGAPLHPNELALAELEKMAKIDGCDIVLCGEGSDDIFGGYGQNFRMYLNYDHKESFFQYFLNNYRYFSISDREIINPRYLVDDFELLMKYINCLELDNDIRNWAFYFIQKLHTPGLITRGANALIYHGFPPGFPFIDNDLVNYVNSLPFEYKIAWKSDHDFKMARNKYFRVVSEKYDIPKYILKKVAEKYLNHKIIYRRKKGFPVPFDKWFSDLNKWDFDNELFVSNNISKYNGWKKFMLINLDAFVKEFAKYKK